jgi:tryptophan synthase beta chain
MGEEDISRQSLNVHRMKLLGATVNAVSFGAKTLKEATTQAIRDWMQNVADTHYIIGSVVGPHPYPDMVARLQSVISQEMRIQLKEKTGSETPTAIIACVGGGSNAMGLFTAFLDDKDVKMIGVEPAGKGLNTVDHAATMSKGSPGVIHGFSCYLLQDEQGEPLPVYSIASGLDYPGVGPQHCYLKDIERVQYESATDDECLTAFMDLSRCEGIIPALESAHAVAYAMKLASTLAPDQKILVNLSGRGDKDIDFVAERLGLL